MDEQFDKRLTDQVKRQFENFEDNTADESWLLLREKFPEKEKDRGIIWWWLGTAAALLLLAFGIGNWIGGVEKESSNKRVAKMTKMQQMHSENNLLHENKQSSNSTA